MKIIKPHFKEYSSAVALLESVNLRELKKSLSYDIYNHFSITDIPDDWNGVAVELASATVVFDLAGSSVSIRDRGAKEYIDKTQKIFEKLTSIIYKHKGIVEKFPGDGISIHFPLFENESSDVPVERAWEALVEMDFYLREEKLDRSKFRFTMAYGEDTLITKFGDKNHEELISIGHAVNVAHKLEKYVKNESCFIGVDEKCFIVGRTVTNLSFISKNLERDLRRNEWVPENWHGARY